MVVYRIASKAYVRDLSGIGASMYGGRWNPKGQPMVYTSQSISLAVLEILAHTNRILLKNAMYMAEIEIADEIESIDPSSLPDTWKQQPFSMATVEISRAFIQSGSFCLQVPSAIIPQENNMLLNPLHNDFHEKVNIRDIRPIMMDNRVIAHLPSS